MAFKKQLVTSCKQAIWGEILGGNAPNYALGNEESQRHSSLHVPLPSSDSFSLSYSV